MGQPVPRVSASPTYFLVRYILGVSQGEPGFGRIRVSPDIGDLQYGQGVVPAGVHGVSVRMERRGAGFVACIAGVPNIVFFPRPAGVSLGMNILTGDVVQIAPVAET
jgi:hypothetical protein